MSDSKSLLEMYNEKHSIEEFDVYKWCRNLYIRCNNKVVCCDKLPYNIPLDKRVPDDYQSRVEMYCVIKYGIKLMFISGWVLCVTEFVAPKPEPKITERLRVGSKI